MAMPAPNSDDNSKKKKKIKKNYKTIGETCKMYTEQIFEALKLFVDMTMIFLVVDFKNLFQTYSNMYRYDIGDLL